MAAKKSTSKSALRKLQTTSKIEEHGPAKWLMPTIESAYTRIVPRDDAPPKKRRAKAKEEAFSELPHDVWLQRLQEYQERKAAAGRATEAAAVGGQNNWVPLGPAAIAKGQAGGRPTIGGRTVGIAVVSGGNKIYAASANGGVFRSDDAGLSWRSLMDGFDLDPTSVASASLCCGAIAVSPADSNRVYVGTGEGETDLLFASRLAFALPAYRGIGPIRTTDGGATWVLETASPSLAGYAFYQLAVDPGNQDNVVAATTNGLYQRASGGTWTQRRTGAHSSVVVARVGTTTTFYAAQRNGPVYVSTNGTTWTVAGTGFPGSGVKRVSLGMQADNPNVLYAFVAASNGTVLGTYRLDGGTGAWKSVSGTPANLLAGAQGDYDLCIAVDPNNANLIYLGGDRSPNSIQRCTVAPAGSAYSMTPTAIGNEAHSDVHVLTFAPGDSNKLWTGTDGGMFLNTNPAGGGLFSARNNGFSSLCTNYLGMSATEPAVIYAGLQDNGTARYLGEELWRNSLYGDGGYCVVHPTDPFTALAYANGVVYRTTSGGQDWSNWTSAISPPWQIMAEPLVGAPGGSLRVAFAAGSSVYVSDDFGQTWPSDSAHRFSISLPPNTGIYSMIFASSSRIFIGTTNGLVYRADLSGSWTATALPALPLTALISDITVDPANASAIYVCLGGQGDQRHVWYFNGSAWQSRSGTGMTGLLDVEHNALLADPSAPGTIYVGADIGVWRSTDSGGTWTLLQNGLPDAPVFDLQLHQGKRLLRASTHGRGVYEYQLNPPVLGGTQLYIRDTELDTARGENTDGRNDVGRWPTQQVWHWRSPNIKVDSPTPAGYQTPTNQINFWDFSEVIVDGSQGVGTIDPTNGVVHNRVYVLAHNRGPLIDPSVRATVAVTNASTVLSPLPAGYTANIVNGTNLTSPWTTLGFVTLTNLRPGFPQVAAFDLPSTVLPLPASLPGQSHFCLVAFLHSASDPYANTQQFVDPLTISEPKVGQKNLHIVEFIGTPPPPSATPGMWARLDISGALFARSGTINLQFDLGGFAGTVGVVMPEALLPDDLVKQNTAFTSKGSGPVKKWSDVHARNAERLQQEGKYRREELDTLLKAMKNVDGRPLIQPRKDSQMATLKDLPIKAKDRHSMFLRIDPPAGAKVGDRWSFSVIQRDAETGRVQGGSEYSVRINKPSR